MACLYFMNYDLDGFQPGDHLKQTAALARLLDLALKGAAHTEACDGDRELFAYLGATLQTYTSHSVALRKKRRQQRKRPETPAATANTEPGTIRLDPARRRPRGARKDRPAVTIGGE